MNMKSISKGLVVTALLSAFLWSGADRVAYAQAAPAAAHKKQVKDQGEYDIYNESLKDIQAKNWTKAITDLGTWKQKYPDSAYKDDRTVYLLTAYNESKQFDKAVETAGSLMNSGMPDLTPQQVITVLFSTCQAVSQIQNPTPDQLAVGAKAAHELMGYDKKPEGVNDAAWATAKTQLQNAAEATLVYIALRPGREAMAKKDCPTAESALSKALGDYPGSGQVAYEYGAALITCDRTNPDKVSAALYELARAVGLDPAKGGLDPKTKTTVEAYLTKVYTAVHGSNEGLDQLKQQAMASPTPPAGFHVKTGAEIATEKQNQFKQEHPQLALWMGIKGQLMDTANGQQYFDNQLKNAAVPKLRGVVVEGKPECRSKELTVAVPEPDAQGTPIAEITLKLDAPLTGKPEAGQEIQWEGVPSAFTQQPFMLTMDTEKAKIDGLKTSPCVVHRPPVRKKK